MIAGPSSSMHSSPSHRPAKAPINLLSGVLRPDASLQEQCPRLASVISWQCMEQSDDDTAQSSALLKFMAFSASSPT